MIPLGYFLIAWLILLGFFGILMILTLMQMMRHGLPSVSTYLSTFLFVAVVAAVVLGSGIYFSNVDWNTQVNIVPSGMEFLFGGESAEIPLTETPL